MTAFLTQIATLKVTVTITLGITIMTFMKKAVTWITKRQIPALLLTVFIPTVVIHLLIKLLL